MSKPQPSAMRRMGAWATAMTLGLAPVALAQPPLDALPSILQLQLSQHPAWRAYKDAAAERAADASHASAQASLLNAMETPARLDALRSQLQAQQQSFDREAEATRAFYAVLSPDQRRVFDDVTRLPVPRSPMRADAGDRPRSPALRLPPSGAMLSPPGS